MRSEADIRLKPDLREQLVYRLACAELDRAARGGGDVFLGGIEAQGGQDGRVDVFDLSRLVGVFHAFGVGPTEDFAAANRAAGQGEAETARPVVPAGAQVDLGGTAKLAAANDDRALEQLCGTAFRSRKSAEKNRTPDRAT